MLVQEVKQNAAHYFSLVTEALSEEEKHSYYKSSKDYESHCYVTAKTEEKVSTPKMKTFRLNKPYLGFIQSFTDTRNIRYSKQRRYE